MKYLLIGLSLFSRYCLAQVAVFQPSNLRCMILACLFPASTHVATGNK